MRRLSLSSFRVFAPSQHHYALDFIVVSSVCTKDLSCADHPAPAKPSWLLSSLLRLPPRRFPHLRPHKLSRCLLSRCLPCLSSTRNRFAKLSPHSWRLLQVSAVWHSSQEFFQESVLPKVLPPLPRRRQSQLLPRSQAQQPRQRPAQSLPPPQLSRPRVLLRLRPLPWSLLLDTRSTLLTSKGACQKTMRRPRFGHGPPLVAHS